MEKSTTEMDLALGQRVVIEVSSTEGRVIGQASYLTGSQQYLVEYADSDGDPREKWFAGHQLTLSID